MSTIIQHLISDTEKEKEKVISEYLDAGYLSLEEHMFLPGDSVESILERIGNVIVIPPVRDPVRFIHYITQPRPQILQIKTGRFPEGEESALVKHLDYRKKSKQTDQQEREPFLVNSIPADLTIWDQAEDALSLLSGLLYEPLHRKLKRHALRFLIYALYDKYKALIPIIRTYRPEWIEEGYEKKINVCGESYMLRSAEAPAVLRLSAEYVRHRIREDVCLSMDLLSWFSMREAEEDAEIWC